MPLPNIPDIPPAVPDQDVAADHNAAGRCNAGLQAKKLPHKDEIHMKKKGLYIETDLF